MDQNDLSQTLKPYENKRVALPSEMTMPWPAVVLILAKLSKKLSARATAK